MGLDLQPLARPLALPIRRVGALGDDPLEPLLLRRAEQRLAVLERLREPDGAVAPVEQRLQPPAPLAQRQIDERLALELEQVEGLVDERRARLALLHRGEARPAALVEGADLAVEHAVRRLHRSREFLRDVRETRRQIVAVPAAVEPLGLTAAHVCDRAVAVPLDLEQPAVAPWVTPRGPQASRASAGSGGARRAGPRRPSLACEGSASSSGRRRAGPARASTCPRAAAVQADGQAAVLLLLDELVGAAVPDLDGAGAVLAGRDLALEGRRSRAGGPRRGRRALLAGLERNALRDRPARQRAVALEPEVVVEPARVVALDDEDRLFSAPLRAERLRRLLRVALAPVLGELSRLRATSRTLPPLGIRPKTSSRFSGLQQGKSGCRSRGKACGDCGMSPQTAG